MGEFAIILSLILTFPVYKIFRKSRKFFMSEMDQMLEESTSGFDKLFSKILQCVLCFFFTAGIIFTLFHQLGFIEKKEKKLPVSPAEVSSGTQVSPSFHKFLSEFADSRTEQLKKVKFPLASVSLNEEDEEKTVMIQKQDWQFRDLSGYANCLVYVSDTFESEGGAVTKGVSTDEFVKLLSQSGMQVDKSLKNTGKRRIHFKGIEHGVSYSLLFQLIGNEWYLVREEDFSM